MPWGLDQKTIDELDEKRGGAHMPLVDPRYAAGPTDKPAPDMQKDSDSTREEVIPNSERRKPSFIERAILWPIVTATRIVAVIIALGIWFVVIGPVWLAMLLRTITAFAVATVVSLFSGAPPPDTRKLDAVAELWIRGFGDIIAYVSRANATPTKHVPLQPIEALKETMLAIFFYSGLFASIWVILNRFPIYEAYFGWR